MKLRAALFLITLAAPAFAAEKKDPFEELVRPTEPLTPEQERAAFHLPPAFGEIIPPAELNDLLAFLLGKRATK